MNDSLRWLLVLGCLCIVCLEAPQDLLQIFQDCSGAYPAQTSRAALVVSSETSVSARVDPGDLAQSPSVDDAVSAGVDDAKTGRQEIGEIAQPTVAFSALDSAALPAGSRAPSGGIHTHRRGEEDGALEPRDGHVQFQTELATDR